jgi:hypothetical protein
MIDIEKLEQEAEASAAKGLIAKLAKATKGKKKPKAAAYAVHKVLMAESKAWGQKPEVETYCRPDGKNWEVGWESGPHEWAVEASMALIGNGSCFCEPHYSFNLIFYKE